MPLRGVIFDFDGLIIDSESAAYNAWCAIYREHGAELALELWVACVGTTDNVFDPVANLCELTRRELDGKALFADKERRKHAACNGLEPLAGVRERFDEADRLGLRLAVASSSSLAWVHKHLERIGLRGRVAVLRTKDDVQRVKPDPELFVSAAAALGLRPNDCLVFEDSLNGVVAAKAGGMRCIAVPGPITRALDFAMADAVAPSLAAVRLERVAAHWDEPRWHDANILAAATGLSSLG